MFEHDFIEISGSLLQSKYGVYVIEINHGKDRFYYYVGQTGDAKVISARSSFYRLAAHVGYSRSTQNQVYEGLKAKTGISNRYDFENWLVNTTIKMHFFKLADFHPMADTLSNKAKHHEKRRKTLALETALLEVAKNRGIPLLNKSGKTYKQFENEISYANDMWDKLISK